MSLDNDFHGENFSAQDLAADQIIPFLLTKGFSLENRARNGEDGLALVYRGITTYFEGDIGLLYKLPVEETRICGYEDGFEFVAYLDISKVDVE